MRRLACRLVAREGDAPFPCVVVDPDGWRLRLTVTPPRPGLAPAGRVGASLVWAEQVADDSADAARPGEEIVIEEEETFDEVSVRLGPDDDVAGLFDLPNRDRTGTGTGERTGHAAEEAALDQQRTAVLAWIAATLGPTPAEVPDTAACAPLKRKIADAPPDPLPPLDGVMPAREAAPRVPAAVLAVRPLGETTATQPDGPRDDVTHTTIVRSEVPRWPLLVAAVFALAAGFAWWWGR